MMRSDVVKGAGGGSRALEQDGTGRRLLLLTA